MVTDFINKVYGNIVVLTNLRGQRRVPYLPEEELRSLRDARLRGIVKYAAETVPYYRSLFQRERINPNEIKTVDDLNRLPLINKEVVCKDPNLFVSISRNGKKSIPFITSGSTGMPLEVYHDQYSLLANIAFGEREREVVSTICRKNFGYREVIIGYPGNTGSKVLDFYRNMTFIPLRPKRLVLSVLEPVELIAEAVNHFHPDVLISYGSYLEAFFKILHLRRIEMNPPSTVLYGGDAMTSEGRRFIEEKFGIPVLSSYSAVEIFKIGFFCEERRGFHIHEDLCQLKIVDPNGEKLKNDEKGEVVISNLVNMGSVFLNYRLGDFASISNKKCPCGRTLLLLKDLDGRVEDIIFLSSGEFVHPRAVWRVFKGRNEILQYQLIQHDRERFELKLVTVDRNTYQRVIDDILSDLQHLLGKYAVIEAENYQELERHGLGKFRPVISLCGSELSL
jgi:phenylacetate-CoA ligase